MTLALRFAEIPIVAGLILIASPSASAKGACGFPSLASVEEKVLQTVERAGTYVPCATCKVTESGTARILARGPRTAHEKLVISVFEDAKASLERKVPSAPKPDVVIADNPIMVFPYSLLVDQVVVVPSSWIANKARHLDETAFVKLVEFVMAHELGHFVFESTMEKNPDPNSISDHVLVDAIGAWLVGVPLEDVAPLLASSLAKGEYAADILERHRCFKKLRRSARPRGST